MGTCTILERSANAITKDLSDWAQNPVTKVEENPAPKGAPAPNPEMPKAVENASDPVALPAAIPVYATASETQPAAEGSSQK
jgi:hypothetical protein